MFSFHNLSNEKIEKTLAERWHDLTSWMVTDVRTQWWAKIIAAYTEPHRSYHTLEHLYHMFEFYDQYKDNLKNRVVVAYAIFFHDIVYDPKSKVNEQDSAILFTNFTKDTTIDQVSVVVDLIEATRGHCTEAHLTPNYYGTDDVHYFSDFDMAILGTSPHDYQRYSTAIRKEYSHLDEATYRHERSKLLSLFLQIPNIFATKVFRERFEHQARENMKNEIQQLMSTGAT